MKAQYEILNKLINVSPLHLSFTFYLHRHRKQFLLGDVGVTNAYIFQNSKRILVREHELFAQKWFDIKVLCSHFQTDFTCVSASSVPFPDRSIS